METHKLKTAYDLVIYGANPAGIAAAIRAAREGLDVLLVTHVPHAGGMLTSGLCVWDTQYEGFRAPVYNELRQLFFDYYKGTYGEESPQYKACLPGPRGHTNGNFEPHVAGKVIREYVARHAGIKLICRFAPEKVTTDRSGRMIESVLFRSMDDDETVTVTAPTFIDASYEGDLMAAACVAYRVGRESREEFNEPHAGKIFMKYAPKVTDGSLVDLGKRHDGLNLRRFKGFQEMIETGESGSADHRVQGFNWRTALTDVPNNYIPITKPPDYDLDRIRHLQMQGFHPNCLDGRGMPNRKCRINRPQLLDAQHGYPDGTWEERHKIMDAHWDALMACLYYLKTAPDADPQTRKYMRRAGLPKDEFADNGYRPYEIYARENRRLEGRYTYTEHDATYCAATGRAPIHGDSIAVTEWYIDIHACSFEKRPGSLHEGKVMLHEETFPGQVPYRSILPVELDNLLVVGCVSSSHVAWSTIRLEPTWMNIGETAGLAASLAKAHGVTVGLLDPDLLVRRAADTRIMLSFFNDVDPGMNESWVPAVQYFGTKGFFPGYDARPGDALIPGVAELWLKGAGKIRDGFVEPEEADRFWRGLCSDLNQVSADEPAITIRDLCDLIGSVGRVPSVSPAEIEPGCESGAAVTRGCFCEWLYKQGSKHDKRQSS